MEPKHGKNVPAGCGKLHECEYHIPNPGVAFKLVNVNAGDHYAGMKTSQHTIVFLLEGELLFSYNEHQGAFFQAGDIFFLSQAVEMYGTILKDAHMLVLSFDNTAEWLCEKCSLSNVNRDYESIDFRFEPLKAAPALIQFASLMETYIRDGLQCTHLYRIKQQELFSVMRCCYSQREMIAFFYPLLGREKHFRTLVVTKYQQGQSVQEFAAQFNMTPKSFTRRFKAEFGMTVYQWMLKQKADRIKLKLSIPQTTFADILQDFNFSDMSHFSKFCKGYFGCTPSQLTAQLRSDNRVG